MLALSFDQKRIIKENLRKFKTSINNHEIEEITKKCGVTMEEF